MESNFTPTALSNKGAMGLTQVMPKYHRKNLIKAGIITTDRDLFNIGASIKAGDMILSEHLAQTNNDVTKALDKYLGGKDGVYVKRIQANLANLYILTHGG
jgi:soluble lytic murein transglycosylase